MGVRQVAISGGRIAAVGEHLPPHTAGRVINATGLLVTPGLVDLHAHLFWGRDYFGIDADSLAWRCGVTTWVDARLGRGVQPARLPRVRGAAFGVCASSPSSTSRTWASPV